jgi:pimeloyl-ACP methyl ester carboxylesterase
VSTTRPARRRGRVALWIAGGIAALILVVPAAIALRPGIAFAAARRAAYLRAGAQWGTVEIEGQKLGWIAVGDGPPILLVHGMRAEASIMTPLARALADRGWRVVALDLPGHGRSDPPRGPVEIDRIGEVVLEAAAALGLPPRPALLGHSMGGWIVAWQALAHPERCGPVVLVSAPGVWTDLPPLDRLHPETAAEARLSLEYFFAKPPPAPWPVLWLAAHRPFGIGLELLRSALSGRFMVGDLLPGISVPALVVAGAEDRIVPAEASRRMADALPVRRYLEVQGAGHMVIWEAPEAVARATDAFLREAGYGAVQASGEVR